MSRRWRVVCVVLLVSIVGVEVGLELTVSSAARVDIVNQSGETIEDLVISYHGTRVTIGDVADGAVATAWVSVGKPGAVKLDFRQKNNGMNGLEIGDYDLSKDCADGFKLVIVVQNNQVQRYLEDDDRMSWGRLGDRIREWLGIEWFRSGP
jgi:hypothetical protein